MSTLWGVMFVLFPYWAIFSQDCHNDSLAINGKYRYRGNPWFELAMKPLAIGMMVVAPSRQVLQTGSREFNVSYCLPKFVFGCLGPLGKVLKLVMSTPAFKVCLYPPPPKKKKKKKKKIIIIIRLVEMWKRHILVIYYTNTQRKKVLYKWRNNTFNFKVPKILLKSIGLTKDYSWAIIPQCLNPLVVP